MITLISVCFLICFGIAKLLKLFFCLTMSLGKLMLFVLLPFAFVVAVIYGIAKLAIFVLFVAVLAAVVGAFGKE